jgi:hypothetical protein
VARWLHAGKDDPYWNTANASRSREAPSEIYTIVPMLLCRGVDWGNAAIVRTATAWALLLLSLPGDAAQAEKHISAIRPILR